MLKKCFLSLTLFFLFTQNGLAGELFCLDKDLCYDQAYLKAFQEVLAPYFRADNQELCRALLRMALVKKEATQKGLLNKAEIKRRLEIAQLRELYRLYMQEVVKKTKVDDKILKSYYLAHPKEFSLKKRYKVKVLKLKQIPSPSYRLEGLLKEGEVETTQIYPEDKLIIIFGKRFAGEMYNLKEGQCLLLAGKEIKALCLEKILPETLLEFERVKPRIKKKLLDLKGGFIVQEELKRLLQKYKPDIKDERCNFMEK
jgi:hypothetical protein